MSGDKTSEQGVVRMGMLHFENDKLPDTKALLRILDGHINATIAWDSGSSIFERCFTSRSVLYCDDPEYKEYVYDLPKQIWFHDAQGSVDLLGCKPDRSMKLCDGGQRDHRCEVCGVQRVGGERLFKS